MASQFDDLEKLADLKNKGIITDEEFNEKKKEILSGSIVESSVVHNKVKSVDDAVNVISKHAEDSFNTEKNTMSTSFFNPKIIKVVLFIGAIFLAIALITNLIDTAKKSNTVSENNPIEILGSSPIIQIDPADLGQIFNLMSEHTDVQRENRKKEIMGKVIAWRLPVYEVKKIKENTYRIQTIAYDYVGTIAEITARNPQEASFIENLKTNNMISYKGKISDITMRHIEVEPAILFGESAQVPEEMSMVKAPESKPAQTQTSQNQNIRTIRSQIDKVQVLHGSTNGQVSTLSGEWVVINTNSEKERDKILGFFSKVQISGEEIEIYVSGESFIGAKSEKYGKIGKGASSNVSKSVIVGEFNGCSYGQGIEECSITVEGKTVYISDQSSSDLVFKKIDREKWIGKKVKLTGSTGADSDYFIAKSIELVSGDLNLH